MARPRTAWQRFQRLLEDAPWPVYAIDDQGQIVFVNGAMETWTGEARESLLREKVVFGQLEAASATSRVAASLAPPPSLRTGGGVALFPIILSGQTARTALGIGLPPEGGSWPTGALVVVIADEVADALSQASSLAASEASKLHAVLREILADRETAMPPCLVGTSARIAQVRRQVESLADGSSHVVVSGPPGIGREAVVRHLYETRQRDLPPSQRALVFPVACPLMDSERLQAALDAFQEQCDQSVTSALLLMELDRLPREAQATLGRFIEAPRPVGAVAPTVFSTVRAPLTDDPAFDQELACRLATWHIALPSLAERHEDVPVIAQYLVERSLDEHSGDDLSIEGFSSAALDPLVEYDWPENVAELSEVVAAAVAQAEGPVIHVADLPPIVSVAADAETYAASTKPSMELDQILERVERDLVRQALEAARGNKAEAARRLGISRARMIRRAKEWGLL